jgi:uncharacterized protein YodC (DUF2158 family)
MKVGDLVKLKSGGPVMTISLVRERENLSVIQCKWFDSSNSLQTESFLKETLVLWRPQPSPTLPDPDQQKSP